MAGVDALVSAYRPLDWAQSPRCAVRSPAIRVLTGGIEEAGKAACAAGRRPKMRLLIVMRSFAAEYC